MKFFMFAAVAEGKKDEGKNRNEKEDEEEEHGFWLMVWGLISMLLLCIGVYVLQRHSRMIYMCKSLEFVVAKAKVTCVSIMIYAYTKYQCKYGAFPIAYASRVCFSLLVDHNCGSVRLNEDKSFLFLSETFIIVTNIFVLQ